MKPKVCSKVSLQLRILTSSNLTFQQIRLKLSGDGTKIGKQLHVVVFTFTILDEDQTGSARGNQLYSNNQNHNNDCLKIGGDQL